MADAKEASEADLAAAILTLTRARGPGKSICPSEAARVLAGEARWQALMPAVRRVAVRLAQDGAIVITKKGKPVDPADFKGVYRLKARGDGQP